MPSIPTRRRLLLAFAGFAGGALAGGCGFRLRGPQPLDFATIHIGVSELTELGALLRRQVLTSGTTTVVEDPAKADVTLQILTAERGREILSLTGAGKVREYQLTLRIRFRLTDNKSVTDLIPPTNLLARREYTFDDSQILGKEQEEALLYNDMQNDLVQQIMRRLAVVHRSK